MSKTDKTRPWWVGMAEAPMVHCVPVHDHRFGPCTLPDEITADTASLNRLPNSGCYWGASDRFLFDHCPFTGGQEWYDYRRETRRRDRHQARRELRAYRAED
ncbi:hypothetical protein ABZ897_29740 [Nonomuraea sp. NPDC046802]|uniref:hypothetical protein n=1 Tax=Nonomuraea sp. NPDC046802 TaxID=3154919 RepID=UPI0033E373C9